MVIEYQVPITTPWFSRVCSNKKDCLGAGCGIVLPTPSDMYACYSTMLIPGTVLVGPIIELPVGHSVGYQVQ